ncbi:MAG: aminotransferase class V-fold PLP-dependent enzyme [Candidatus Eiseniibacteriota bacterium]
MSLLSFIPGPSRLYPTVRAHLDEAFDLGIPSLSHRSAAYQEIYRQTAGALAELLGAPASFRVFFVGSASEAMERVVQNTVDRASFHLVGGAFAARFHDTAAALGKRARRLAVAPGSGCDVNRVVVPDDAELLCITQNETSTGVQMPMNDVGRLRAATRQEVLIVLDVVSSVPFVDIDFTSVDGVLFSVQKGLGLPAGLGVLVVGEAMLRKAGVVEARGHYTGGFHSFAALHARQQRWQNPETPNVLAIWLLGRVCRDMLARGVVEMRDATEARARALYEFFSTTRGFAPFVHDERIRSRTVVTVDCERPSSELIGALAEEGIAVAPGYGERRSTQIRVANFPAHTQDDVAQLTGALSRHSGG